MKVTSELCRYLYLPAKQFCDKFFNQHQALKHVVCEKLEVQDKFIKGLQESRSAYLIDQVRQAATVQDNMKDLMMHDEPKKALEGAKIEEIEDNPGKVYTVGKKDQHIVADPQPTRTLQKVKGIANMLQVKVEANPPEAEEGTDAEKIFDMTAAPEDEEQGLKKLDKQIEKEMDKANPNMNRLIKNFRERRLTI